MMTEIAQELARQRAEMVRDAEYICENVNDSDTQERILQYESAENGLFLESDIIPLDLKKEIHEAIERIPDNDDQKKEEIDRILSSEKDTMSLDEVMGIQIDPMEDIAPMVDAAAELAVEINSTETE